MKTKSMLFALLLGLFAVPSVSMAYFTTAQKAMKLSDTAGMFLIEYVFGDEDEEVYMPLFGQRDLAHNANTELLGYEILEESETVTDIGETAGIVLSNAQIEDGMYRIPAGEAKRFTFVGFFVTEEDAPETDYALHIQELPFYVGAKKEHRKLNPSELQYYITPEIELNANE